MIILSWNVSGLNSTWYQKSIHDLIAIHSLDVFCVQETKVFVEVMHHLAPCIWYVGHYQIIGSQGIMEVWPYFGNLIRSLPFGGFLVITQSLW